MLDDHNPPDGFGILPTIFGFPTYTLCLVTAVVAGVLFILRRQR